MFALFPHCQNQVRLLLIDPARILEKLSFCRGQFEWAFGNWPARESRIRPFDILMDRHFASRSPDVRIARPTARRNLESVTIQTNTARVAKEVLERAPVGENVN